MSRFLVDRPCIPGPGDPQQKHSNNKQTSTCKQYDTNSNNHDSNHNIRNTQAGKAHKQRSNTKRPWRPSTPACELGDLVFGGARRGLAAERARPDPKSQSYTSKGIWRLGIGLFCKEFLCFDTVPCRHMPLLVHFWTSPGSEAGGLPGGRALLRGLSLFPEDLRSSDLLIFELWDYFAFPEVFRSPHVFKPPQSRGNHLSNTTCLTHKTIEAVLDK